MAEQLWCRKGHSWEPKFPAGEWPPNFQSVCPVCGDAPLGPFDMTVTAARALALVCVAILAVGALLIAFLKGFIPCGVMLLVVGGLIPLAGVGVWYGRARAKSVAAIAEAMNFAFTPRLTLTSLNAIAPFRILKLGHSQKAYNAMQGRVGDCDVLFFEYQYTTGRGKGARTDAVTAVLVFDGAGGAPDFQVAPKTFFDRLIGYFTHDAIDLEVAGEFARRCKLTGADAAAVRETFHPDLVEYLGRDGRFLIEARDGQLLVYRQQKLAPGQFPGLTTDALEIRDLLREGGPTAARIKETKP